MIRPVFLAVAILALSGPAFAKGGADNPVSVKIDPSANSVKIDPAGNDVDVVNEVEIKNATGTPIAVDLGQSPRTPFVKHLQKTNSQGADSVFFRVQEGELLVIEHVSAKITMDDDAEGLREAFLLTNAGGETGFWHLGAVRRPNDSATYGKISYTISENLRLYADPDTNVVFSATVDPFATAFFDIDFSLSGYLVPADEPSLSP